MATLLIFSFVAGFMLSLLVNMKKYLPALFILAVFGWNGAILADDIAQKTDGSFIGWNPKTINSSFMGDDSGSVVNDSFIGEDISKSTDSRFVGAHTRLSGNNLFSGDSYHQQVKSGTQVPFAEDNSDVQSDRAFIGENVKQKTDGSFVGSDSGYGR